MSKTLGLLFEGQRQFFGGLPLLDDEYDDGDDGDDDDDDYDKEDDEDEDDDNDDACSGGVVTTTKGTNEYG